MAKINCTAKRRIFQRDGRLCSSCGSNEELTIDHIVPLSKGGGNNDDNLQVLCLGCNSLKASRDIARGRRVTPALGSNDILSRLLKNWWPNMSMDEQTGLRHKITTVLGNSYLYVSDNDIMMIIPGENQRSQEQLRATTEAICRISSKAMKLGLPGLEIAAQLRKSDGGRNTILSDIATKMEEYFGEKGYVEDETPYGRRELPCPQCQPGGICGGCGGYDPTIEAGGLCDVCFEFSKDIIID